MQTSNLAAESSIGLIAGWGRFPLSVSAKLKSLGHHVVCVAIKGHADRELERYCDHVFWSGVGRFGAHVRFFRRHGVSHLTMAGKLFKHEILYGGGLLLRHRPDFTCVRTFWPYLMSRQRDARDDSLLNAVIDTYERNQMTMQAATDLVPELLATDGLLAGEPLSSKIAADADSGWQIAKTMGGLDIGQAITIRDGVVIAVEAIEGTDACIQRTGSLCRRGGWTLVKVAKPNQDMRFDVPTIGTQTVQMVADAGGSAIVIEAGRTILLDASQTIALANQLGVAIQARRSTGAAAI
ncbi:MAG: UDP-2,3-diacylglucosamine diphosphatase LpxI [Planctomycetota bacterium]